MSGLNAFAIGHCAKMALVNKTFAHDKVFLQPNDTAPLTAPFIEIFVDTCHTKIGGADILSAIAHLKLRFNIFVPVNVPVSTEVNTVVLDTNRSSALVFALFERQIQTALLAQDTPWAVLFRRFIVVFESLDVAHELIGYNIQGKVVNFEAFALEYIITPLVEPAFGQAPIDIWADFLELMRKDHASLAPIADLIAQIIQGDKVLNSWQQALASFGLSVADAPFLGLGDYDVS